MPPSNLEVVTLWVMQARGVAQALMRFFSRVGLPQNILTDKGGDHHLGLDEAALPAVGCPPTVHDHIPPTSQRPGREGEPNN